MYEGSKAESIAAELRQALEVEGDHMTPAVVLERKRNQLAARVSVVSTRSGARINAYHARADIDELERKGFTLADLPAVYAAFYGRVI